MLVNVLTVLVPLALAVLFFWLVRRAWRSRNGLAKYGGSILGGLLGVLLSVVAVVAILGLVRTYQRQPNAVSTVKAATAPEQVARGEQLAHLCIACHSSTGQLPLDGSGASRLSLTRRLC